MKYPEVIGEIKTVDMLRRGYSLARFGDGELKMMDGKEYIREPRNPFMADELRRLIKSPNKNCLVGIPTMDPAGPKYEKWQRRKARFCKFFGDINYYSAFVSRPDGADWLDTESYAVMIQSFWLGKPVTVVSEPGSKLLRAVSLTNKVCHVPCPSHGAYSQIGLLERLVLGSQPELVLLSCGPTATCLANRLAPKVQAIDLGSIGQFLIKHLKERVNGYRHQRVH